MSHHYAGSSPDDAALNPPFEIDLDEVFVPGTGKKYNISTVLDSEDVIEEGDLVRPEIVKARSVMRDFFSEYDGTEDMFEVFLGYAENGWDAEQMWRESELSRSNVYELTESLEEEYNLIETDYGHISLTASGEGVYGALQLLFEE